jgi:hypothetical protein
MAVWFHLNINDTVIGMVEIRRRQPLDLTDQAGIQDVVSIYTVSRDHRKVGEVQHRYGDGAWRLVAAAADLIACDDDG